MAAKLAGSPGAAASVLEPLGKLAEDKLLDQFVNQVIDHVCGKQLSYLGQYGKTVAVQKLNGTSEYLQALFKRAAAAGAGKDKVAEAVEVDGQLPKEIAAAVGDTYAARAAQLRVAALNAITAISSRHLADFDWRVNLGWSSSSLATLRQPTLLLNLTLANVDGTSQQVPVELTSEELGGLIATLDKLNRARLEVKV